MVLIDKKQDVNIMFGGVNAFYYDDVKEVSLDFEKIIKFIDSSKLTKKEDDEFNKLLTKYNLDNNFYDYNIIDIHKSMFGDFEK